MLALVRYLGNQKVPTSKLEDETFFPLLGRLIHYPINWVLPIMLLAGFCFTGLLFYIILEKKLKLRGILTGLFTWILIISFSAGLNYLIWLGIRKLHPRIRIFHISPPHEQ